MDGVQELDGVHGGPRSEAQCQAKLRFNEAGKARASRLWSSERSSRRPRRILRGRLADLADRVTEWTESRNWTESTEAREAKRSALVWPRTDRVVLTCRKGAEPWMARACFTRTRICGAFRLTIRRRAVTLGRGR